MEVLSAVITDAETENCRRRCFVFGPLNRKRARLGLLKGLLDLHSARVHVYALPTDRENLAAPHSRGESLGWPLSFVSTSLTCSSVSILISSFLDRGKYARQCLHFPKADDHRPTEIRLTFAKSRPPRTSTACIRRPQTCASVYQRQAGRQRSVHCSACDMVIAVTGCRCVAEMVSTQFFMAK